MPWSYVEACINVRNWTPPEGGRVTHWPEPERQIVWVRLSNRHGCVGLYPFHRDSVPVDAASLDWVAVLFLREHDWCSTPGIVRERVEDAGRRFGGALAAHLRPRKYAWTEV